MKAGNFMEKIQASSFGEKFRNLTLFKSTGTIPQNRSIKSLKHENDPKYFQRSILVQVEGLRQSAKWNKYNFYLWRKFICNKRKSKFDCFYWQFVTLGHRALSSNQTFFELSLNLLTLQNTREWRSPIPTSWNEIQTFFNFSIWIYHSF